MVTVTDADVGQEAATEGVLEGIVMLTAPTQYDNDYFCLMDGDVILFNIHVATSGTISYQKLTLKSIPKGSSFELTMALPPVLSVLVPDTAVSGDPDFTLSCTGTGFTKGTVIKFGSNDEPTTFVSDTEVTTGVKPSLFAPAVVPVSVHTGTLTSDPLDFTFTEPVVEDTYKG
jgi:hypothetical protein